MVGVPGRSKGCNTCIQRKIKCGQETPHCRNCRKSGRVCTGYKRKLGYVFSTDVNLPDDVAQPGSSDNTVIIHQGRWKKSIKSSQPPNATYGVAEAQSFLDATETPFSASLLLTASNNPALLQQMQYLFLHHFLPSETTVATRPRYYVDSNWMLYLQDVGIQSPALQVSVAAFFTARVGRINKDMDLVHRSHAMYVSALDQVRRALVNPRTRLSDETMAATMALSLYEITECPGGTSGPLFAHASGSTALLKLRGPDASASPLGHSLFKEIRARTIVNCLISRRETFLSRPEWIQRPWKVVPKAPYDLLIDLMFQMPALYRQIDEVSCETDRDALLAGFHDVIAKFSKLEAALRATYQKFEKSVSGPLYTPELSTLESRLDDPVLGKVFPVSFYFSTFLVAEVVTTYWSAMMAVHHNVAYTYRKLAAIELPPTARGATPDSSSLASTPADGGGRSSPESYIQRSREHIDEWKGLARNICQSAQYFLQDGMGGLGPLVLLVDLSGCLSCWEGDLEEHGREAAWTADMMQMIRSRFGLVGINRPAG